MKIKGSATGQDLSALRRKLPVEGEQAVAYDHGRVGEGRLSQKSFLDKALADRQRFQQNRVETPASPDLPEVPSIDSSFAEGFDSTQLIGLERQGLAAVSESIMDQVGMSQSMRGSLAEVESKLARMRQLGQEALFNISSHERRLLDDEYQALKKELGYIAQQTSYNGISLYSLADESLTFSIRATNLSVLGNLYLERHPNFNPELHEEDFVQHRLRTEQEARTSLSILDTFERNLFAVAGALTAVENRLGTQLRRLALAAEPSRDLIADPGKLRFRAMNSIRELGQTAFQVHGGIAAGMHRMSKQVG